MDPCPVLIGREQEMASLRALLDAGGGVAIVSGEAGIGKSRLVREFAAEAASRGRVVLWGRPEEVAQPGPYALIVDLLESIAELGNSEVKREARALAVLLGGPENNEGDRPPPTARAVAAELRGLASRLDSPPMLVLEDLHRGDESSHAVLLHLARSARDDAHVLITTYRAEMLEGLPSLGRLVDAFERERVSATINLGSLDDSQVVEMLDVMMPGRFTDDAHARIASLGEGVPFFIEELAEAASSGAIPKSVELTVSTRLQGLGSRATDTVRAASLLEGAIEPRVLATALGIDVSKLSSDLLLAVRAGLLEDREGRLIFRHSLMRDAVASGIVSVQRADIHRRIAAALEDLFPAELKTHSAALAHHWEEAGNNARAAECHLIAGERALALAATAEARFHFSIAQRSSQQSLEATRGVAEVEFREGNEDETVRLFKTIAEHLGVEGDNRGAAKSLSRLAWALRNKGASDEVFRTLDEALELLNGEEQSREYVEVLIQKGQILSLHFGRFSEAKPILHRAFELALKHQDPALVAESSDGLAHVADGEGHASEALEHGDAAMRAAKQTGMAEIIGRTHNNHAVKLASFGHPEMGLTILAEVRDYLLHAYGSAGVSVIDVSSAWIHWLMGLPSEVAHLTARGQAAWQRWRGYRRILEIWSAVESGQLVEAESRLVAAWSDLGDSEARERFLSEPKDSAYEVRQVVYAEALLLIHTGEAEKAARLAKSVVTFDRESLGESFDVGQGLLLLASSLLLTDDISEGNLVIEELQGLLEPIDRYPYLQAHVLELGALSAAKKGDYEIVIRDLEAAVDLLEACTNASDRARCHRRAGEMILRMDSAESRDRAVDHLRAGLSLAERAGASAEKNRIEAALRALGIRPRAGRPRRADQSALTPREAEVAVLVAAGTTNAKIADELFLSERTVQDHISNALRKLGLSGRAGLATWAVRQGLV